MIELNLMYLCAAVISYYGTGWPKKAKLLWFLVSLESCCNRLCKSIDKQQCHFHWLSVDRNHDKKLSYRQQIACQLCTESNNSQSVTGMTFKGHWRSSEVSQFDRVHMIYYYRSILWPVLYRFPHIARYLSKFVYATCIQGPCSRDVREWLSTFPFPPIPIYSIPINPSHPHFQVFDLFPFPCDSRVGYSHSLPFPFRVSDRVRVSLGMWNNPKFTTPSIASIRIMSSVYMQISIRKVKSLPMSITFRFVT